MYMKSILFSLFLLVSQMSLAQNQQLKQFVTQTLPKLQQHQQHVLQTAQAVGLTQQGGDAVQAGSRQSGSSSGASGSSSSGTSSGSSSQQQKSGGDQ